MLGDGACSTGRLRGRLAQPNETRRCGAGFRLAVVTGDLEHSAVKGSPPRRDQRPGSGGFAVQLRVAGLEPCQLFERLQRAGRVAPFRAALGPRPAGPQPTSTGRRSSRCRRGCPIEPVTAGRRPAPPPVPSGPRAGRLPGRPPAAAGSGGPGRGPWRRGCRRVGRPAPGGTPPRIARAAAGPYIRFRHRRPRRSEQSGQSRTATMRAAGPFSGSQSGSQWRDPVAELGT